MIDDGNPRTMVPFGRKFIQKITHILGLQNQHSHNNKDVPNSHNAHQSEHTRKLFTGENYRLATRAQFNWNRNWFGSIGSIAYWAAKLLVHTFSLHAHAYITQTFQIQYVIPYANTPYTTIKQTWKYSPLHVPLCVKITRNRPHTYE